MSGELYITAFGRPITQGSKTKTRWGMRDSNGETLRPWRDNVRSAALDAIGDEWETLTGPVRVLIVFRFDRPQTHYRTGRNAHLLKDSALASPSNVKSGDIDKLQRACFDALTDARVWKDDCQVVYVEAIKVYVSAELNRPGVDISVRPA